MARTLEGQQLIATGFLGGSVCLRTLSLSDPGQQQHVKVQTQKWPGRVGLLQRDRQFVESLRMYGELQDK